MVGRWGFLACAFISAASLSNSAYAGAWSQPKGQGQVIVKYEPVWSIHWLDSDGNRSRLPEDRFDHVLSIWGEYGLTDRITLYGKTDWQDVGDDTLHFRGMGPLEIGARYQVLSYDNSAVSVQGSLISDSDGRNSAWAEPGVGEKEAEVRILAGTSFGGRYPSYIETQIAGRWREHLPSELRLEGTAGVHLNDRYMAVFQVYSGRTFPDNPDFSARWTTFELGAVRHYSDWSLQAGWRSTVIGRNIVTGDGPILGVWRRF